MFCVGGSVVDDVKAAASQGNVAAGGDVIAAEVKSDALVLRSGRIAIVRTSVGRGRTCVDEQAIRERNVCQKFDGRAVCSGGKGLLQRLVLGTSFDLGNV